MNMTITKEVNGSELNIALEGRLDTTTAPMLEEELNAAIDGITVLVFDFAKLEYISSAGLRILLAMQKKMNKKKKLKFLTYPKEIKLLVMKLLQSNTLHNHLQDIMKQAWLKL